MAFFSIITVTWNAENEIDGTAESIRNQSFGDYEWIVVDGASSDQTLEKVNQWTVPGRDTVLSEADNGIYDAMNKGLNLAKGEVVHFLNAGDTFAHSDVLEQVHAEFTDEVDAVYGDTTFVLMDGRVVERTAGDVNANIANRVPICHQALFVRRALHLKHRFDTGFKIAADYAVMAALFRADATFRYTGTMINRNTIEATAVSVKGRKIVAKESFRIQRDILGQSFLSAGLNYLRKRMIATVVTLLQCLPPRAFAWLPEALRRRVY